ncbi:rRNA (cytosine-C5-)-methyltransferase nop2 [Tulasnella sp. 425]|nr:rRNA (cytosine-C5-)-methyltransferase nop2 [Tulasnella sp. 425]
MIWFAPETATLSVVLGYTSITCWLGAQLPQIIENFKTQSVDGLALPFLVNWLFGDATNLIGCILTDQLPFQKYLASYFCLVDICLVAQFVHYSDLFKSHKGKELGDEENESEPPPTAVPYTPSRITSPQVRYRQIHNAAANIAAAAATAAYEFEQTYEQPAAVAGPSSGGVAPPRRAASTGALRKASRSPSDMRRHGKGPSTITAPPPNQAPYEDEDGDEVPAMYESFHSEGGKAKDFARRRPPLATLQMSSHSDAPSDDQEQPPETAVSTTSRGRKLTRQNYIMPMPGQRLPLHIDPNAPPLPYQSFEGEEGDLTASQISHRRAASLMSTERNNSVSRRSATIVFLGVWALFGVGGLMGSGKYSGTALLRRSTSSGESVGKVWGESDAVASSFIPGHDPPPPSADSPPSDSSFIYSVLASSSPSFSSASRHHDDQPHAPKPKKPIRSRKLIIGRISAWLCTTLYLTSRLPQIWKNFVRKSVEGLSITLFVAAFLGNTFYVSSILTNPIMNHPTEARAEYIRETIPYLLGSGGTLLFDITIVSQSFIYAGRKPRPARTASISGYGGSVVNRRSVISRRRSATVGEEERLLGASGRSESWGNVRRSQNSPLHLIVTMGRKQRLKQGDPASLDEFRKGQKGSAKKRKARDLGDSHDNQPPKKSKAQNGRPESKKTKGKGKAKEIDMDEDSDEQWGGIGMDEPKDLDAITKFDFEEDDQGDPNPDADAIMDDEDDDFLSRGPVHQLEFSDDSDAGLDDGDDFLKEASDEDGSEGDSDDSDGPITAKNMERKSRALDRKAAREAEMDIEEVQAAADGQDEEGGGGIEFFDLPTAEELEQEQEAGGIPPDELQKRIQDNAKVLKDFKALATKGRSRSEHVEQLLRDIASYYGYNEFLTEKLFNLFSVAEAIEFFEANEVPRPVTIRANTLRTRRRDLAQALINRGVTLEPLGKWSNVGLQIFESTVPIGATPEYLAGHYMLQAASSFLPVIALAPEANERILDMASAPGGKATYISALMRNTGIVFANDSNKARTKSLTANVHRMGCKNVVVCNYDGREFPKVMGGFDRVLLDSPCSGTGVISKDPSVKLSKSEKDFQLLGDLQRQLILCAIDSVNPESKTGGYVTYSTCSVTVDENEAVVDYALRKRPNIELVDTGINFGVDGFTNYLEKKFSKDMHLTKRFYPHVHNMDGFFVAKFKVNKPTRKKDVQKGKEVEAETENAVVEPGKLTGFDAEEDKAIIDKWERQHVLKTKGIKIRPKANAAAAVTAH